MVRLEYGGVHHVARWELDSGDVLSVWAGSIGPLTAIKGGLSADALARHLLREYLEGAVRGR